MTGLLAGVSLPAASLALAMASGEALAQAVNGTPTVVFGADAPTRSPTTDAFNINANEALIDWAVTDNSVFLNAGTTLAFSRDGGAYTVLNRVASAPLASTLALNGRVQSDAQGKIWFYNPGGWVVGSGATIDVGSLVLTSNPITVDLSDPIGQRFVGPNGEIRFGQAAAGSSVTVSAGANIVTRTGGSPTPSPSPSPSPGVADDSYIALVAPRVVQAGVVDAAGSVAYVGADAVDITINNGLFDIAVTSGTADPNGVVHTGTTTGASNFGSTPLTQFLVAVGKNDALTMLVRGQLGYNAASSAGFVNGRIVLSSGQGITANNPDAPGPKLANISLSAATLQNDLSAAASDAITVEVGSSGQNVVVSGDAALTAKNRIAVSVSGVESRFLVSGDLSLAAQNGANGGALTVGLSNGGALLVGGDLLASADGFGARRVDGETGELMPGVIGEAARGGTVSLTATGATLQIDGNATFSADARGGIGGLGAGSSTAGSVSLTTTGSTVALGDLALYARGISATSSGRQTLFGTTGAASTGGNATLNLTGGATLGAVLLDNSSSASFGDDAAAQAASTGNLSVRLAGGTFTGSDIVLSSFVDAVGGGAASGGAIDLTVSGATVTLGGGISLAGQVLGDIATMPGAAGSSSLTVTSGSTLALSNLSIERIAIGTVGSKTAKAGDISLQVSGGGSLAASGGVSLFSEGQGAQKSDAAGGSGTGGTIDIAVANGTLTAGTSFTAQAAGIAGGSFSGVVTNETGRGGTVTLSLGGTKASISAPDFALSASGTAAQSEGSLGGTFGIGGSIIATIGGGTLTTDSLMLSANGEGGTGANVGKDGTPTAGGIGRGGSVGLTITGGTVATRLVELEAAGEGGFGASSFSALSPAGRGGDAFGGSASLALTGGTLATDELSISAGANVPEVFDFGEGGIFVTYYGSGGYAFGDGGVAGAGGTATGGSAGVVIDGGVLADLGGTIALPLSVSIDANGFGGNGGSTGGGTGIGTSKSDGGLGSGGTATFAFLSGSADFLNLTVAAAGIGGIAGFEVRGIEVFVRAPAPTGSSLGADGGDGRGGAALVTISENLEATNSNGDRRLVLVDAIGAGGNAADGDLAGNGGNGFGGSATLEINGATVALIDPAIDASGSGGIGGRPGQSNPGGDGGAGFGGSATLRLSNAASFRLTGGALIAGGFGAEGRAGANGNNGLLAPGNGGKGGDALGGVASLLASGSSNLTLLSSDGGTLAFNVSGDGGDGGLGGASFGEVSRFGNGGAGGSGTGGGIIIEATDTALDLGAGNFNVDGFGGDGGGRVTGESGAASEFSAGGDGGNAQGGSIRFTALGAGAALNFSDLTVSANGFAGSGADGQGIDAATFAGAPGGNGAAGTGGTIVLEALSGGAFTVKRSDSGAVPGRVSLVASGLAGVGGDGANGATNPSTGVGGAGGNGGNSGQGDGGSITLVANGGTFSSGSFEATAKGEGRFGGFGGAGGTGIVPPNSPLMTPPASNGADGTFGIGGGGVGGTVDVSALTDEGGAVGGLSLGDTFIDVTGTINFFDQAFPSVGGKVSIIDRVDDSNGGLRFASLGINATGDVARDVSSVDIESSDGPILVDGNLSISAAGDVNILTFGTGGIRTGGFFEINNQGTVQIEDDFCAGVECPTEPTISAGGLITVNTAGNFLLIGSPTLVSDINISIDAGGSITGGPGSGYRAPGSLSLSARGDIAVRNADVGSLDARAGRFVVEIDQGEVFEDRYEARDLIFGEDGGGGRIVVEGSLSGLAGGDIAITSGARITTGSGLSLVSGDDIVVGSGASLTANFLPAEEAGTLVLNAGGIVPVGESVAGNVASLIAGSGSLIDATNGPVQLLGGAIDTRGARIAGRTLSIDVRKPPAPGAVQGNDNGQLSAPCLAGDICIGDVTITDQVRIGQGENAPVRFLGTGNITGSSVAIRSRETLAFGTSSLRTITAGFAIALQSQNGDIALAGGATLSGGTLDLSAGGSLTGNGTLVSAGDIGLTVGDSVTANRITAAGQLTGFGQTGGEREALFSVPGSFTVNQLQLGADAAIAAGDDIVVGSASLGGNDVAFDAGGLVSLGSTAQVGDIALSGDQAAFGALVAGGSIAIAAVNAVSGTSAIAGGALTIDGATISATTLRSGGAMALTSSGATTLGSATSGAGLTIGSGALTFSGLTSTGATAVTAASVAGGNIAAGTGLDVRSPGAIGLGTATAGTTLALNGATITATRLQSGQGMTLTSTGRTSLGTAASEAGLTISSAAIDFSGLTSTGATAITAASVAGGNIAAGTGLDVRSPGAIGLGTATAGTTLALNGATITATRLQSEQGMTLTSSGTATLGSATSGAGLTITSAALTFGSLTSSAATAITATSVSGGDIDAGSSLAIDSANAIDLDDASAGTTLTLDGTSISAGALSSGGDTTLTAGSVNAEHIDSGGGIAISADTVTFGTTRSTGLTKVGAGTLALSSANATGGLDLSVTGAATLGTATSGAALAIKAGSLSFASLASTGATAIDAGSVAGGNIVAGTSLAVLSEGALGLGDARAGTTLALNGATIAAGSLVSGGNAMLTAGSITATGIDSGARIDIASPGAVALGTTRSIGLTKIGAGTLTLPTANATGGLELTVANTATLGTVQSGAGVTASARDLRFIAITASGNIAASATTIGGGDATSTAGAVGLTSTGATTVGQLRAGTDVTVTAPTLTFAGINAARNVTLDIGTLNGAAIAAGQDLTIRSVNSLTFGTVGAGRNVSLSSSNGTLTVNTDLDAGGTIALSADAIAVRAAGALRVNTASADNGNISIVTDGLLRVDSASAIGDITLTSTANSLIVGGAVEGDAPNVGLALTAETTTGQGSVGAGAITLGAANDITLLATVDANTSLAATAGGLIDQRGLAVGRTVAYRSADIALGQGASLGQSNFTTGIALTNTGTPGAILGDVAGTTSGYRLDNAEFGRVHSGGDLSLAGGSSLSVGTLSASAATATGGVANGNIGATSTLALSTSGELSVGGALALGNAGGNTLRLTSGGALFVDAGSGSVRLVEGSGRGGSLAVSAGSVMALTPAARNAIVGLDTRALDQRLAMNDGVTANRTLLEAGAITISSNGAILIQNTAPGISFDERRGFVADSLTLITRSGSGSTTGTSGSSTSTTGLADIVINGTVGGLTGLSALRAVDIEGSFSDFSTINGCRIVTTACGTPQIDPIRDLIEEEVELGSTVERGDGLGESALIVIDRIEPAGFETVIDEPVTGAGNDDFLVPEAGAGDEVCTEEDQTKCDKPPAG